MSGFNTGVGPCYHNGWVTAANNNLLPDSWMVAVDQVCGRCAGRREIRPQSPVCVCEGGARGRQGAGALAACDEQPW
jgi:hypothetical protein